MARTIAELPKGTRITDYISLGVLTKTFPLSQVKAVLAAQGRASQRQRELPAHVVVYYVIAWRCSCKFPIARCCAVCWKAWRGCWGPDRPSR